MATFEVTLDVNEERELTNHYLRELCPYNGAYCNVKDCDKTTCYYIFYHTNNTSRKFMFNQQIC